MVVAAWPRGSKYHARRGACVQSNVCCDGLLPKRSEREIEIERERERDRERERERERETDLERPFWDGDGGMTHSFEALAYGDLLALWLF